MIQIVEFLKKYWQYVGLLILGIVIYFQNRENIKLNNQILQNHQTEFILKQQNQINIDDANNKLLRDENKILKQQSSIEEDITPIKKQTNEKINNYKLLSSDSLYNLLISESSKEDSIW